MKTQKQDRMNEDEKFDWKKYFKSILLVFVLVSLAVCLVYFTEVLLK